MCFEYILTYILLIPIFVALSQETSKFRNNIDVLHYEIYLKITDFENEIDPVILNRGVDYYKNGRVIDLIELKKDKWSARVDGTELYKVMVQIQNDKIVSSTCNCPYEMGDVCKHEVAVYCTIRDGKMNEGDNIIAKETSESKLKKSLKLKLKKPQRSLITESSKSQKTGGL